MKNKYRLFGQLSTMLFLFLTISCTLESDTQKQSDMSPTTSLDLSTQGDLKVGNEITIKLTISPATGLGEEFFDTPLMINFTLPDSFKVIEGKINQELNFKDFSFKTVEIKVVPSEKGTFNIKVDTEKENSGKFWKTLTVNIGENADSLSEENINNGENQKTLIPRLVNVSLNISNAPLVGETAIITLSVKPLVDGDNMTIHFRVPEEIEVIGETGELKEVIVGRPKYLFITKSASLKAGERRDFEIKIKILKQGRFEISGGANIIYPDHKDTNVNAIILDVGENNTIINPPPSKGLPVEIIVGHPITPPKDNSTPENNSDDNINRTMRTPDLPPPPIK